MRVPTTRPRDRDLSLCVQPPRTSQPNSSPVYWIRAGLRRSSFEFEAEKRRIDRVDGEVVSTAQVTVFWQPGSKSLERADSSWPFSAIRARQRARELT